MMVNKKRFYLINNKFYMIKKMIKQQKERKKVCGLLADELY